MLKVLQFHKISPRFEFGGTNNTPGQFENFVRFILASGFTPALPSDLEKNDIAKPIIITFDDGYRSVYDFAFPIIKRYSIKAIVFLITKYIGSKNLWDIGFFGQRDEHLSWTEITEMKKFGVEFGSHTVNHVDLTRLTRTRLEYELYYSKDFLEKEIGQVATVSFPFNRINHTVLEVTRQVGYRYGFGGFRNNSFPMPIYKDTIYITDNQRSIKIKLAESPKLLYKWERFKSRIINLFSMATVLMRQNG